MKTFVFRTTIFLLACLFFYLLIGAGTSKLISKSENYILPEKKSILVLGSSHAKMAFDDTLINGLINYSQAGSTYFYELIKMKKICSANPSITTVLIEFTNKSIAKEMTDWTFGPKFIEWQFPNYGNEISFQNWKMALKEQPIPTFTAFYNLINLNFRRSFSYAENYKSWISKAEWHPSKLDLLIKLPENNWFYNQWHLKSDLNIEYLRKMVDWCKSKNINVILTRAPLYKRHTAQNLEQEYQQVLKTIFPDVSFLDFKDFPIRNNEFFDPDHLNYNGFKRFSKFFNNLVTEGMLAGKISEEKLKLIIEKEGTAEQ